MKNELIHTLTKSFEGHVQETENGVKYWLARDLQHLLGCGKWDNFQGVISKAKTACELSGHRISDHFADVGKMIELGKGGQCEVSIHNAREQSMHHEPQISQEHVANNEAVRQTLLSRGIRPESLPPDEDVKKVERRLTSAENKAIDNPDGLEEQ